METQVKVLGRRISIPLISLWIFCFQLQVQAHPIVQYWENESGSHPGLIFEPRVSFYNTSDNFNSNSQSTPLPGAASVSRMYYDLNLSYGLSEDWFLFGRVTVLTSKVTAPGTTDASVTGLGDQMLGLSWRLIPAEKGLGLNLQFSTILPAYSNPSNPGQQLNHDPYRGDGSIDMTAGAFLEIPVGNSWKTELGGGYTYRSKGYSSAFPWSAMLKHIPDSHGALFALGARGQISMNSDKTTLTSSSSDQIAGAAGSNLIDAINPGWLIAQAELGYKNNQGQTFYVLAGFPIAGTNSPRGTLIAGGIQFDFGTSAQSSPEKAEKEETPAGPARKKKTSKHDRFTTYDLEAAVTSVNDSFYIIKIDKGTQDGVEKGQTFDIFHIIVDPITTQKTEKLIARASVTHLKDNEAALNVLEYYIDQWIEEGFTARRVVK